jgi:predicted outer membrane repeat protein
VTVDDSSVISNTAAGDGGGIYNDAGALNVQNSSLIGVTGRGNRAGQDGGGICNRAGTATLDASSVVSNTAASDGGGIHNQATLNVQNGSTVSANACSGVDCAGGGIYNADTATVDTSSVISNTAEVGGGIFNGLNATTSVWSSRILNSTAGSYGGGGIHNFGTTSVNASTISDNTANSDGGGIYSFGTITVDASTLSANTAEHGGGIYNDGGRTTVTSSRILNNTATTTAGGVWTDAGGPGNTRVTGSCIVGNSDTSFFNDEPSLQIATGNWWGASTGPNTPGADTVEGDVDTSGYLTTPILGCTPDLQVSKANDTGGEATTGTPFHWTLTITNIGITRGVFSAGQEILVDDLPVGPAYGAPTVVDLVNVIGGADIDCGIADNTLTCEAGDGDVTVEAGGGFALTFSVTANDAGTLRNPAGICRVDPDGRVIESDENNNCPADTVTVAIALRSIYLPLAMRNAGAR